MDENIMNENVMDMDEIVVDEQNVENIDADVDFAAIGNGLKIGAVVLAVVGIAGAATYKKFGPKIKVIVDNSKKKALLKKQEKLAKKSFEVAEKLAKFDEEKGDEETE